MQPEDSGRRAGSGAPVGFRAGEVIVSPSPSAWHQEVLSRVVFALRSWAQTFPGPIMVGQSPLAVRFARGRILQPDAFVLLASVPKNHAGPLDRVPEICIEVLSRDRIYDRVTKRMVYAEAGVREFWSVDPAGLVERWTGDGLAQSEMLRDRLRTPLLPGFDLDVEALLAE